jgi:hypothetical protein
MPWFNYAAWVDFGTARDECIAEIVADLTAYVTTNEEGVLTFDEIGFMAVASTKIGAINDPSTDGWADIGTWSPALRGTNIYAAVAQLTASISGIAGTPPDLNPYLLDLKAKSAAVSAYYDRAFQVSLPALLDQWYVNGELEKNVPVADDTTKKTLYVRTTFVNDWENESAPSPVSDAIELGTKDTYTITVGAVPSGRNLAYWRAYQSNSGNAQADFQYVPVAASDLGVAIATPTLLVDVPDAELQEVCPTTIHIEPPADLTGIASMANGVHVGWKGNRLFPTPNFKPWTMPAEYAKTTTHPIVGAAPLHDSDSLIILTRGNPAILTGSDPAMMGLRTLDDLQACVSERSIWPTKLGVVFASPDGLCLASPAGVQVLTNGLFTREEWQALDLSNLIVREHDGNIYFGFFDGALLSAYLWAVAGSGTTFDLGNQRWNFNTGPFGSGTTRDCYSNVISGKAYCEFVLSRPDGYIAVGISSDIFSSFGAGPFYGMYTGNGGCGIPAVGLVANGSKTSNTAYTFGSSNRLGVAVDVAAGKIWYSKNGVWIVGDPVTGASPSQTFTPGATWRFATSAYSCNTPSGTYQSTIYPAAFNQLYAAPTGFTPFQP